MNADEEQPTAEVALPDTPVASANGVRPDVRVAPATLTDGPNAFDTLTDPPQDIKAGTATVTDVELADAVNTDAANTDAAGTEELLRPKPDVIFAPVAAAPAEAVPAEQPWGGPHEVTGPQPLVGADGSPVDESQTRPVAAAVPDGMQRSAFGQAPVPPPGYGPGPQAPYGAYMPQPPNLGAGPPPPGAPGAPGRSGRRGLLVVFIAMVGLLAIAAAAYMVWPSGDKKKVHQAAPASSSASASPGAVPTGGAAPKASAAPGGSGSPVPSVPAAPAPTGPAGSPGPAGSSAPTGLPAPAGSAAPAPVAGSVVTGTTAAGMGVRYETSEVAAGYYEGSFTLTNNSKKVLNAWTIRFNVPGAVIDNVWGGTLVKTGSNVVIKHDGTSAPIAPGASVTVRFGGSGTPATPGSCRLNGQPCGF